MEEVLSLTSEQIKTFLLVGAVLVIGAKKFIEYMGWFGDRWEKKQMLSPTRAKQEREKLHKELIEHESQAEQERIDLGKRITVVEEKVVELKSDIGEINKSLEFLKQSDLNRRMLSLCDKIFYYKRLGFCPKDMKETIAFEVTDYIDRCHGNHITKDVLKDLLALPDSHDQD